MDSNLEDKRLCTEWISRGIRAFISLLAAKPPVIILDKLENYRQALFKKPKISLTVLTNACMLQ